MEDEVIDRLEISDKIDDFRNSFENTNYKVYGLSGEWGVGKTTFVKFWEKSLCENDYIHIDVFKEDYKADPLVILINAFSKHFSKDSQKKASINNIKEYGKKLFINSLKSAGKLGVNIVLEKTIGKDIYETAIKEILDNTFGSVFDEGSNNNDLVIEFKTELRSLLNNRDKDLFVVIDELDRCRPDLALELLEKIKHLFSVDGIKFLIVYNPRTFKAIIERKYGIIDNNNKYLMKYIEKEIIFQTDYDEYVWFEEKIDNSMKSFRSGMMLQLIKKVIPQILTIKKEYNLSLRDMERYLTKIETYKSSKQAMCSTYIIIELLRLIDTTELEKMIDYVNHNGKFASNVPDKYNFDKIFSKVFDEFKNTPNKYDSFYIYAIKRV